jgi:autotransporter-associated beta strand protein
LSWEDPGFIGSNYELIFGSKSSNARLTWTRGFSLTESGSTAPYAARTIRVLDNPAVTTDWTRISGSITGTRQNDLVKTGPGMLELTAVNTYAGATIIHGGTLLVNSPGDSKASFVHDVLTDGTLGGNGIVGAVRVNGGGKLAPGSGLARTETLNVIGDLSFIDGTSQLVLEIGGATVGSSTAGYDRVNVTGTVSLGNADLVGSFVNGFTGFPNTNDVLFLILNDGLDAVQGQFLDGSLFSVGGQDFAISYNADSTTSAFSSPTGNDVAIQLIPEPSSAILLGLGALLVSRRRRAAK